ncbi:MAG: hypothetical protein HY916_04120 [Desulfovibrio sp.]|jgi:hypothetical protein|nr:hypothetical protein [Desulfovibrio sp.]
MEEFKVAYLREQGQDMVIVPVSNSFGRKSRSEQADIVDWLQGCASSAGLAGVVVPVWDAGGGRMGFLAPRPWQTFFKSLNLGIVARNINKTLRCS